MRFLQTGCRTARLKQFWVLTVITVLTMGLLVVPAYAKKVLLQTQLILNPKIPVMGETIPWMAEKVKMASDGQVIFKLNEPGKLVPSLEILQEVSNGSIDAGYTASGFWVGLIPAAPLFASVPFGPAPQEYLAWLYGGNGLKLYQEMYDQAGYKVKVLPITMMCAETSGWFGSEITSAEQLNEIKIRFYGLGSLVMQKLGASVTGMPPGEIFPALEKGVIDATEFSNPAIDRAMGFYKIVKNNYFPGWHQQATITEILINKNVWEKKLSPSQRELIEMACMAGVLRSTALSDAMQGVVIKENAEKHGVKNRTWSKEMLGEYEKAWTAVAAEQSAKDPFFKKVWDDLQSFRSDYSGWAKLGYLPRKAD